jgi:fatty-acyl-CoA synthase
MTLAYDWIAHHARYSPDRLAQIDVDSGRSFTYAQFDDRASRLAHHLRHAAGVKRGDRVAVLASNTTETFELLFACQRLGAILLPLNWRLAVPELEYILNDAEPRCLVYGGNFAATVDRLASARSQLALLRLDYGVASPYEAALQESPTLADPEQMTLDDPWSILYTSGTSGRPKGAILTYGMVGFSAVNAAMKVEITQRSRGLTFMPLFHAGGLYVFALFITCFGGRNYILRGFDAKQTLDMLADRELGITHVLGVPTNFIMVSELPQFRNTDLSHVQSILIGGAAAPVALLEKYLERGIVLQQGWGMTETATTSTVLSKEMARAKIGSCGQPTLHLEVRVVDGAGKDLPAGEVGELLVRGPTITPGYWNRPDVAATAFIDGWFRTGDAVRLDGEGYLYIVDRIKDMYISGGENVYPLEVEDVLHHIPGIVEAAVIGVPDVKWGEVGRAFIVRRTADAVDEATVLRHCEQSLARFKVPKQIRFVESLPHNATGKLQKHLLPRD